MHRPRRGGFPRPPVDFDEILRVVEDADPYVGTNFDDASRNALSVVPYVCAELLLYAVEKRTAARAVPAV